MSDLDSFIQRGRVDPAPRGDLPGLSLTGSRGSCAFTTHGAQVLSWRPTGTGEILFVSARSEFAPNRAIRGGIPVVFPWFGPKSDDPSAPSHGFARLRAWQLDAARVDDSGVAEAQLSLRDDDETRRFWPHPFSAIVSIRAAGDLRLALEVHNPGPRAMRFEAALHTYFAVGDIEAVTVGGLEDTEYLDKTDGFRRKRQSDEPIRFTGETDRVYLETKATCVIDDPSLGRRITIAKEGSSSTVVWNPWVELARSLPDFGDDEWRRMVCVETAAVKQDAIMLAADARHRIEAIISVEPHTAG